MPDQPSFIGSSLTPRIFDISLTATASLVFGNLTTLYMPGVESDNLAPGNIVIIALCLSWLLILSLPFIVNSDCAYSLTSSFE